MSEDRQYWPTDAHMTDLRLEGKLPYSNYLALCLGSIAALGCCYLIADRAKAAGTMLLAQLDRAKLSADLPLNDLLSSFGSITIELIVLPALVVSATVLLGGISQNKFYISSAGLSVDLSRTFPRFAHLSLKQLILRTLKLLLILCLMGATSGLVLLWAISNVPQLLAAPPERVAFWTSRIAERISIWGGVFLFLSGGAGLLISRVMFKLRHRMTRAELEQQLREGGE